MENVTVPLLFFMTLQSGGEIATQRVIIDDVSATVKASVQCFFLEFRKDGVFPGVGKGLVNNTCSMEIFYPAF